jgi:hypothetical protein
VIVARSVASDNGVSDRVLDVSEGSSVVRSLRCRIDFMCQWTYSSNVENNPLFRGLLP